MDQQNSNSGVLAAVLGIAVAGGVAAAAALGSKSTAKKPLALRGARPVFKPARKPCGCGR